MAARASKPARGEPARPAAGASAAPAGARQPRQERGQRRVDAILDATAAIVAEEGIAAATMHAIARRSGTTIGSMYHFFPDREAVIVALAERHGRAIGALAEELAKVDWSRLSLEAAIDHYVETCIDYVRRHPDLLEVGQAAIVMRPELRSGGDASPEHLLLAVTRAIVAARTPDAPAAERTARAALMLALVEGTVERSARFPSPPPSTMYRELKRALCAYLGSFER